MIGFFLLLDDVVLLTSVGNLIDVVSRPKCTIDCWGFFNNLGDIWLLIVVGIFFRIVIDEFNVGFVDVCCTMIDFLIVW